jgi:chromosome segregation ATPase
MTNREAYKQKLEAELEIVEAKIAQLRAAAKSKSADAHVEYNRRLEQLEEKLETAKARLSEIGDATEETWEGLKAGAESAWVSISESVKEAFADSPEAPKR